MNQKIAVLLVFVLLLGLSESQKPIPNSYAQGTGGNTSNVTYICLESADTDGEYLIGFTNVNLLGFVPSISGTITIYSGPDYYVLAGLYHILPDAQTGGYRRNGFISTAYTNTDVPTATRPCFEDTNYEDVLPEDFEEYNATISLPVLPEQAVLMSVLDHDLTVVNPDPNDPPEVEPPNEYADQTVLLDRIEFRGVAAFHFLPRGGFESVTDFQLIQLGDFSDGKIDLTIPFLDLRTTDTDFVLITNKSATIFISSATDPIGYPSDLVQGRGHMGYQILNGRLDNSLVEIMRGGNFRIYPAGGIIETYLRDYIRISMSDSQAQRNPEFYEGQIVQTLRIPDLEAHYFRLDDLQREDGSLGSLKESGETIEILRITNRGQLIVGPVNVGTGLIDEAIVEAWFVEDYPND